MKYFEIPTQVSFYDFYERSYVGGIAYEDKVICGHCGETFFIEDIYNLAPENVAPIKILENWTDIEYEIRHG